VKGQDNQKQDPLVTERAGAGESDCLTELYAPLSTPERELGSFGIGIGVYFSSLRWFAIILFISGVLNLPSMNYYSSEGKGYFNSLNDVPKMYRGSAVCANVTWVACSDCDASHFGADRVRVNEKTGEQEFLKNDCLFDEIFHGIFDSLSLFFQIIAIGALQIYQKREIVNYDENEQTAQDYSLLVKNPPEDALDPDEWRSFFAQFSVTGEGPIFVTVALNNGKLLLAHVEHRKLFDKIEGKLPHGIEMLDREQIREIAEQLKDKKMEKMLMKLDILENEIRILRQEKFKASAVYVSFNTEVGQRRALNKLSTGKLNVWGLRDPPSDLPLFHGRVLDVKEPDEPSSVRWKDLGVSAFRLIWGRLVSNMAVIAIIACCAVLIDIIRSESYVALVIALINALIPRLCKFVNQMEKHYNETTAQISLYIKISVLRWTNTALLITAITPFTSTLSTGDGNLLSTVANIFVAEIFTSPTIRLLDIPNTVKRHFIAPRAKTQIGMIRNFSGAKVTVAERYTESTKIVFLCFYYGALMPYGFFMGSVALIGYYIVDKFCLLRTWGRMPKVGKEIADFQRRYLLNVAVIFLGVMSAYTYASFPYDNLCEFSDSGSGATYKFCDQDLLSAWKFPPLPSFQPEGQEWMTPNQTILVRYYSVLAVFILVGGLYASFGGGCFECLSSLFRGSYEEVGHDMGIDYSTVPSIFAYVPQIEVPGFMFPLIACDITGIDGDHVYWRNPNRSHDYYSIVNDVADTTDNQEKMNYSVIKYYPPVDDG